MVVVAPVKMPTPEQLENTPVDRLLNILERVIEKGQSGDEVYFALRGEILKRAGA